MLNWKKVGDLFMANTRFFTYTIIQCDDQPELYEWNAHCTGTLIKTGEPDYLDECKEQAEQDLASRLEQGQRVIDAGKYVT